MVSKSPALAGYIRFVECVRRNQKAMPISEAVDRAVQECIDAGILRDFLLRNRAEVVKMMHNLL